MQHHSLGSGLQIPTYVANTRRLRKRRQHILAQLTSVGAADVTIVHCADAEAIASLPLATYQTLHPQYTRTAWSPQGRERLPNGTLSLALKHRLAHWDMWRRRLRHGLVIEDDVRHPGCSNSKRTDRPPAHCCQVSSALDSLSLSVCRPCCR